MVYKVITGLGGLRPDDKPCSLIGCIERVLLFLGETYDLVELMGLSGAAFRLKTGYSTWSAIMGGRLHPGVSTDISIGPYLTQLTTTTGYSFEYEGQSCTLEGALLVWDRIQRETDNGMPSIACNMENASLWGIVAGYDPQYPRDDLLATIGQEGLLAHTYCDGNPDQPSQPPRFPWNLLVPSKCKDSLSSEIAMQVALTSAVADFETPSRSIIGPTGWFWHFKPEYSNGLAAYDAWIGDLVDDAGIEKLPYDQYMNYWQGTAWMYDVLHHARSAAHKFLDRFAARLSETAHDSAMQASLAFKCMTEHMEHCWGAFPYRSEGYVEPQSGWIVPTEQEARRDKLKAAYSNEWTREMRHEAITVLRRLKEYDQQAFGYMKRALS